MAYSTNSFGCNSPFLILTKQKKTFDNTLVYKHNYDLQIMQTYKKMVIRWFLQTHAHNTTHTRFITIDGTVKTR